MDQRSRMDVISSKIPSGVCRMREDKEGAVCTERGSDERKDLLEFVLCVYFLRIGKKVCLQADRKDLVKRQ